MNICLTHSDFKILFPHITHFEFELSLARKGLKYVRMIQQENDRVMLTPEYRYEFKVIDEPIFMMHTIKNEITPIMVEDVDS